MYNYCVAFLILFFTLLFLFLLRLRSGKNVKRIYIVVLGDIGRSPRMQYHAVSFARAGYDVHVFGYSGSEPHSELKSNASIHLIHLKPIPSFIQRFPRLLMFISKVLWQAITLTLSLLFCDRPSHVLVQNPPSLPTLFVCWLISVVKGSEFIIDWHNYGFTIMALSVGPQHFLTKIYEWNEKFFGRFSSHNICVSNAMKEDLMKNWSIRATTMYDRPSARFRTLDIEEKHNFLYKLPMFRCSDPTTDDKELTIFTEREKSGKARFRTDRPALLISSTSWTEDEDFSILLNALDKYDDEASTFEVNQPSLVCIITGKGPQKDHYLKILKSKDWSKVTVYTPWLEPDDYPCLLACADLGVCLHKSSSGLDLPMKVIDMFGCCLPVCALHFPSLIELVQHDKNGLVFNTESELAQQIQKLLHGFPDKCRLIDRFRENLLQTFRPLQWDEAWTKTVLPIFDKSE